MTRDGTLANPTRQNIYELLDNLKVNRAGLQLSDRSGCPANSSLIVRESIENLAVGSTAKPVVETTLS